MFGQTFYFSLIKKYVVLVGTLFNDIKIVRTDSSGNMTELIKVPISYAPKDKMLQRVLQDPNIDRPTAVNALPMISFEMGQIVYDGARKLNTIGRSAVKGANSSVISYQYNPVPYNFDFKVYIYAKNAEDANKILEQILPFFTPDWTTTVDLIPQMNEVKDIPIIMNGVHYEDNYDDKFEKRRAIVWTLNLTLKGYLYGPVKSSGVIKFVDTTFYIPQVPDGQLSTAVGNTNPSERVTVQPGLDANGNPTSNISITIPYNQIQATDNFGYIDIIYNENQLT